MLYALRADHDGFKEFVFRKGLNIVLANRSASDASADLKGPGRTRNGAGKSSIVDILHFLLGGKPEGALQAVELENWTFSLDADVGRDRVSVNRKVNDNKTVRIVDRSKDQKLSNAAWIQFLGEAWFDLKSPRLVGAATFRQLFSYFARRKRDGGYDDPVRTFRTQSNAVTETNLAVLFDLDAEIVRRFHQAKNLLKQNEVAQRALRDLDKRAALGDRRVDLEAQLSAEMAAAQLAHDKLLARIEAFNVLPAFRELETELAGLNQEARELSNRDVVDKEIITVSEAALFAEGASEMPDLAMLYREADLVFGDTVYRRYSEVSDFHSRLVENRRNHLDNEIRAANQRIERRQVRREELERRRRQIVNSLRTSGPAEELLRLRDELSSREADLRGMQVRLYEARRLDEQAESLQAEIEEAGRALRQDRRERSALIDQASRAFSEISERLYERPGQLVISASENGLRFIPSTPADKSAGVMSMEIFCFDLTLALLCNRRGVGPGFLVHDSHLFEPVDGRQFARALRIASKFCIENDLQYVVMLNSDELMRAELEGDEDFGEFILEPSLADISDGGLFGFRFD
jgi:uncharacterized protein YydD (DUF2326 family)